MKIKEIIEELKKEYPLSKEYEYRTGTDDGGKIIEIDTEKIQLKS